eukprot:Hpha_TRINITY_DN13666_c0_g1::TRINITY_DN13666_c0_g1_i2::g.122705::m.122705
MFLLLLLLGLVPCTTGSPTTNPSTTPSRSPTFPSTVSPTKSPSLVPTAPPLIPTTHPSSPPMSSPTKSPSLVPTTPPLIPTPYPISPTQRPSKHPTLIPTTPPIFSPTKGPSEGPMEPSAQPTQPPTVNPLQPSSPPNVPPSEPPSTDPTLEPTRGPAPDPTTPPISPTVSPERSSASAPLVPTTSPSGAPTPLPPRPAEKALAVAGGFGDAGGIAALVAASGPAAAQAGRLTVLLTGCLALDELPVTLHPTGLRLEGFSHPSSVGCVAANLAITFSCCALHYLVALSVRIVKKTPIREAQGLVRFPSVSVTVAVFLTQGSTYAGSRLLTHGNRPGDWLVGALAMLVSVTLCFLAWWHGRKSQLRSVYKLDPAMKDCRCLRYWLGDGEWISFPAYRHQVERWSVVFRSALPKKNMVIAMDITFGQLASVIGGLGGLSCATCGVLRLADFCIGVTFAGYIVCHQPFVRRMKQYAIVPAQLLLAAGALFFAVGYFSSECGKSVELLGHGIAANLLAAAGMLLSCAAALDLSASLRAKLMKRNLLLQGLLKKLAALRDRKGRIQKERLRNGMSVLGRRVDSDEFERIFAKIDTDGNGAVDFRDFLSSEYLFQNAGEADTSTAESQDSSMPMIQISSHAKDSIPFLGQESLRSLPRRQSNSGQTSSGRRLSPTSSSFHRSYTGGRSSTQRSRFSPRSVRSRNSIEGVSRTFDSVLPLRESSSPLREPSSPLHTPVGVDKPMRRRVKLPDHQPEGGLPPLGTLSVQEGMGRRMRSTGRGIAVHRGSVDSSFSAASLRPEY